MTENKHIAFSVDRDLLLSALTIVVGIPLSNLALENTPCIGLLKILSLIAEWF